jgi:hypothetical protein
MRRRIILIVSLLAVLAPPAAAHADFGLAPGTATVTAANEDGTVDRQASSHPYSFTVHFELKTDSEGKTEGGEMRDARITLPPGFVGNPTAIPQCTRQQFEGKRPNCKGSTQVGILRAIVPSLGEIRGPIFNIAPPPGIAAQFGFSSTGFTTLQYASLMGEQGYRLGVSAPDLPLEATFVTATFWGSPADPSHDAERFCLNQGGIQNEGCSSEVPTVPYLTLPSSCGSSPETKIEVDSKLAPGAFVGETVQGFGLHGEPTPLLGCESVPFEPGVSSAPGTGSADTASGLDFSLSLPGKGLLTPGATAETEPVKTVVTLPKGVTANPAAAGGLTSCSPSQLKSASAVSGSGQGCPESSKLGTLMAETPLLEEPIEGSVYLATPHENPFGSLLALYIVARAPQRGILIKQAGEVQIDATSGQLTTTFDQLPPLPYSSFQLRLREGPRAPLITPQLCGTYTTEAKLYPFSDPANPVVETAPFQIVTGAAGGPCAAEESQLTLKPSLKAGTVIPVAGGYSPFVFHVSRVDGEQRLAAVNATLPKGLVGKLAGVTECSDAQLAAAAARIGDGGAAVELSNPSCPASAEIGVVDAAAGAGSQPYHVQGKAYLAGPYKGAPLSMAIVTPALAGPFDLGVIVVRAGLYVEQYSAQISVRSDPIPTSLQGIPLDVRSITLSANRDRFTLNPTSCGSQAVTGEAISLINATAPLSTPFQVAGCNGLDFAPKLAISLKGPTRRTGHPALKAVVTFPQGAFANVARASVALPHSEFLDQGNLDNVCTQPQLRSGTCPARSIYGRAKAWTPLLDEPLEGPVYLGTGFGHQLPDLVADLNGQIRVLVHGRVDTSPEDGLRNTFEAVPDAPVSRFVLEMQGGKKKGLLENSENVCRKPQRATARFTAQNGKVASLRPKIANSCGKRGNRKG